MEMTLEKCNNYIDGDISYAMVWKTSEASEYSPFPIIGLTVLNPNITVTENEFKNSVTYNLTVDVSDDVAQNECWFDLVPIQYKVRYMGREYVGEAQFDGYSYYADIPELHISFMSFSDIDLLDSKICVTTYLSGAGNNIVYPSKGVYTITVLPYSDGAQISKTLKLTITDESGGYPQEPMQPSIQESSEEQSKAPTPTTTEETEKKPTPSTTVETGKKPTPSTTVEPEKKPTPSTTAEPEKKPTSSTTAEPEKKPTPSTTAEPEKKPTPSTTVETGKKPNPTMTEETDKVSTQDSTQLPTNEFEKESTQTIVEESIGESEISDIVTENPTKEDLDKGFPKAVIIALSSVTITAAGVTLVLVIRKRMG
jgi:hypothetical protein